MDINAKNRRKSSVFRRILDETIDLSTPSPSHDLDKDKEKWILNYVQEVEKETDDWMLMYKKFRSKFNALDEFKNDVKVITKNECANDLRREDIEFLNAIPDYEAVCQRITTLSEKIEIVKHKCHQMKVAANDRVTKTSLNLYETKKRLCEFLDTDKEFNLVLNSFNDSGNYSIDDSGSSSLNS